MKNFAMLGRWHVHADGYANEINNTPGCHVAKVWDPDEANAAAWAEKLGCVSASVEDILADPAIDGVVVCAATNEHGPLLVRACDSGKAVFTEKVLTLTEKEALEVEAAIKRNGTTFAISFPHFSESGVIFAMDAIRSGKLGAINYARVRKAHNGATGDWLPPHFYDPVACGGGALIDLGAHPMYLLCAIMDDEPVAVQSSFTNITGKPVEDNAVSLLTFANGAIGVSETGFVSYKYPFTIEVGGTEGSLNLRDNYVTWCCAETDGQWVEAALPERQPSPIVKWATAESPADIPAELGIAPAIRLTRVMEKAYK